MKTPSALVFLLLSALPGFSGAPGVLDAADFGAKPDDGVNDLPALRLAVAAAVRAGNCTLRIAPGRYDLSDDEALRLQNEVLSGKLGNPQDRIFNRDFAYVTALDFTGADRVTVEAAGVEFLVDGWMEPVSLQRCRNVTINGLLIDCKRPPNSEGEILAVGNGTVDVRFAGWCPVTAKLPFIRLMVYDREQRSLCGEAFYSRGQELIAPQTLRFKVPTGQCRPGRVLLGWHGFHFRPAILLYEAKDTVLNDVTIHAQPGMGIVGHLSENLTMNRLRIVPRAGRFMSTNTDATHFVSCRGRIRFDACEFAGQGDDATNLHCFYTDILSRTEDGRCTLATSRRFETHSVKRDYPRAGDTLAVVRRSTLEEVGTLRVKSVELSDRDWSYTVAFEGDLPADIANYSIANITASPALEFVNCRVRSHRARSVLVKTRNVLIEGCTFEHTTGTAIHIGAEGNWMEGVASADVIVRGNTFLDCGLGGANDGTIDGASAIAVHVNAADRGVPGLHKRLLFENNRVTGGGHAITVKGAEDVTIRGNTFTGIRGEPVVVDVSRRVYAHGNEGASPLRIGDLPALPNR
ncbi:MAG: right-handed parallel beta-helix repeat-containing protein [Kiritimatiellia bacterium]